MADVTTDIRAPCSVCGQASQEMHHMIPRGRRPDLVDDKANQAPVCRPCHDWLEPSGPWRLTIQGEHYVVLDLQNGDEICRRPVEGGQSKALALLENTANLIDPRDKKTEILTLVSLATDDEIRMLSEWAGRMGRNAAFARMLAHWEAWVRYPWKDAPSWADNLAKSFEVSPKTIYEDVRVGRLFAEDMGPPMDASWYRVACHAPEPAKALEKAHEMREEGKSIQDFRVELRETKTPDYCPHETCPDCGATMKHRRKA